MKRAISALLMGCSTLLAHAGTGGPGGSLSFSLERTQPALAAYQIRIDAATGRGTFHAEPATSGAPGSVVTPAQDALIAVSQPVLKKLLAAVPAVERHRCESHSTNIAQTGKKTLLFQQNDKSASCSFNFSDDDRVNTATTLFEAIGETMQYGQQLASKLRFDRLGLDEVMDNLSSAVDDGRAVEIGNIAPVLESIENDDRVMDRVRRKAARLLEQSSPSSSAQADPPSSDR